MGKPFGAKTTAQEVTEGIDLTGKTVLITGVNSGLGLETMRVLSLRGAYIIALARDLDKAEAACALLEGPYRTVACELSSLVSVRACVETLQDVPHIDILIANAGIMALPTLRQANGIELQFATNHIGHFALVTGLLDKVKAAQQGRIVMLSSAAHQFAPKAGIQFDNLSGEKNYGAWTAYGQSKLANVLFAKHLNTQLVETGVKVNALHPGGIQTNLARNFTGLATAGFAVVGLFVKTLSLLGIQTFKSVEQGAATTCYVACHPDASGVGGEYFADCSVAPCSALARDKALAQRLWETSEALLVQ